MRIRNVFFLLLAFVLVSKLSIAQPIAGTDDLGRTISQFDKVGSPKSNKQVAMFYFLWQESSPAKAWDLHEIWTKTPQAFEDFDHPGWGGDGKSVGYYYWGQPIYGYYKGDDYWVHVRNMQLLADAGVDMIVLDATNDLTYPKQSEALMQAIMSLLKQGKKSPKIVYYTNTNSGNTMQTAYNKFYKKGAPHYYPETWYTLEGKPLIIGVREEAKGKDYENFFTFRESQWPNEGKYKTNGWPWIEFERPQHVYSNDQGKREIINVSVAQHPNPVVGMGGSAFYGSKENWGRSYRNGSMGDPEKDIFYGYNVQEQWDYALKQDVPFVFVTGWNEWIAGKWPSRDDNPEHSWFCDQASPEYSRDIEPTLTAGLRDHYYMQLVDNIRKYKGIEDNQKLGRATTIKNMSDWNAVSLTYTDYINDTEHRKHPGTQIEPKTIYENKTGRNDFKTMKVARDAKNVYFYAETVQPITPIESNNWMVLYLDMDRSHVTGWKGYDYRIIKGNQLQKLINDKWVDDKKVAYQLEGNKLTITVPKTSIGLVGKKMNLEFKWSDNMQDQFEPLDWYINGDTAPGGRFNYIANE